LKCLEKKPERRYASAAAMADDLRAFLSGNPIAAQSLTFFDQVARTISHNSFDGRFRGLANRMLWFSPVPLVVHLVALSFFWGKSYYPIAMVLTTAALLFTMLPLLIFFGTSTLRDLPVWQRRHFTTVWAGHLTAMAIILFAMLISTPASNSRNLLMVYSFWAVTAAMSFLAHATEAGMYYMVGGALFCAAILMALTPDWAPVEIAFIMTANMFSQALYLRTLTAPPGGEQNRITDKLTTVRTWND
jgi:serine/threonine-protein kinase